MNMFTGNRYRLIAVFIILGGVTIRLLCYLVNPSLDPNEAAIAVNLMDRTLTDLLVRPLEFYQCAPIGFLASEKMIWATFGSREHHLRLLPLLMSILSLALFYQIFSRTTSSKFAILGLFFLALSEHPIRFACQVKQYSSDLTVALLAYLIIGQVYLKAPSKAQMAYIALCGAVLIAFSFPAIFVLGGAGICCAVYALIDSNLQKAIRCLILLLCWTTIAVGYYFVSLHHYARNTFLLNFWSTSLYSGTISVLSFLSWADSALLGMFGSPLSLSPGRLAELFFILGSLACLREYRREALLLLSPIALSFIAAVVGKYPFGQRPSLFLVPIFLILIAAGICSVAEKMSHLFLWVTELVTRVGKQSKSMMSSAGRCRMKWEGYLQATIEVTFTMTVAIYLLSPTVFHFPKIHAYWSSDIKQMMGFMKDNIRDGDSAYIYYVTLPQYLYYAHYHQLDLRFIKQTESIPQDGFWVEPSTPFPFYARLNKLRGTPRVWVVFSHIFNDRYLRERQQHLTYLDKIGHRLAEAEGWNAAAYLYDLKGFDNALYHHR